MTEHSVRRVGTVAFYGSFFAMLACNDTANRNRAADSAAVATIPEPAMVPSAAEPGDTVTGAGRLSWTAERVAARLRSAGFEPLATGPVRQRFMVVPGTTYQVGDATVQVYIYGDAIAVGRDTDVLDSVSVAPPDMRISWIMPPSLVVDNNLAAIVLTRNDDTRRRIRAALTAEGDDISEP